MSRKNGGKVKISESGVITEQAMMSYLRNELTSDEKLEFEKLLKEDPFAQDAFKEAEFLFRPSKLQTENQGHDHG